MRRHLLVAVVAVLGHALSAAEPVHPVLGPVPVERVIDGDTVILASNLGPRVVRLIGIDAPESSRPGSADGRVASAATRFLRDALPEGTNVWVELDLEIEDTYGRLLAYVYVKDDAGDWRIDGEPATMVNVAVAEAGYARALTIEPNSTYADLFADAVRAARDEGAGMWAEGGPAESAASADPQAALPPGDIVIACALYDPPEDHDRNAETVTLLLRSTLDTRGYYLYDEGSGTTLRLPPGEHEPGELVILNPDQGIWNNGGDTIYLKRGQQIVDQWDYTEQRPGRNGVVCRDDP